MTLEVHLLGTARFSRDGQPLDLAGSRPLALLAYLLISGRPHSREHLIDLLFEKPDDPRAALRWTLTKLRKALGAEALTTDRQTVSFNFDSDYWLDVAAFEKGDLSLYSGELLAGLYVRDARQFESWLMVERERLRALYQEGLEARLAREIEDENAAAVELTALQLLQLDNLREDWLRTLMNAYAAQGKFEAALAQYELSSEILREELDQEPAEETTALAESIRANQAEVYRAVAGTNSPLFSVVAEGGRPESLRPLAGTAVRATNDVDQPATSRRKQIALLGLAIILLAAIAAVSAGFASLLRAGRTAANEVSDEAPAAQLYAGRNVTLAGPFSHSIENYEEALRPFEERTGIDVQVIHYSGDFEDTIARVVDSGITPDIVNFPQPGYMADFAQSGEIVDVRSYMDETFLREHYSDALLDAAMVGDQMPGIWHLASVKGLVWYPKPAFEEAGYKIPATWEELMALTEKIAADGTTPWCVGMFSGEATGWPGTDWIENILLRTQPPEVYDAWVAGDLPFDSPEVRGAFEILAGIWMEEGYVYGGAPAIASEGFIESALMLFQEPPGCFLHNQGTFIWGNFPEDLKFGVDYDFFYLPPIDPRYGRSVLGGGDLMAMFNDRPEVRETMRYLATGESARPFVESGAFISPHRDAPFEWYSSPLQLKFAQLLLEADTYRFDGSDLMPGAVGAGSFWTGMVDWVEGEDLDAVLKRIDESWPEDQ